MRDCLPSHSSGVKALADSFFSSTEFFVFGVFSQCNVLVPRTLIEVEDKLLNIRDLRWATCFVLIGASIYRAPAELLPAGQYTATIHSYRPADYRRTATCRESKREEASYCDCKSARRTSSADYRFMGGNKNVMLSSPIFPTSPNCAFSAGSLPNTLSRCRPQSKFFDFQLSEDELFSFMVACGPVDHSS